MPLPKYDKVICPVFSGCLYFPLCQAMTKSLYFCWKTSCREKSVAGLCVYILRALWFFPSFFFNAVFFNLYTPTNPENQVQQHIRKTISFFTKVNKMLAPEYSQQTLAPKLFLIQWRRSLPATYMVSSLLSPNDMYHPKL